MPLRLSIAGITRASIGLRAKLAALVLVVMAPFLALLAAGAMIDYSASLASAERELARSADEAARVYEIALTHGLDVLHAVADRGQAILTDPKACEPALVDLLRYSPTGWIYVAVGADGWVRCSSGQSGVYPFVGDRPFFQAVMAGQPSAIEPLRATRPSNALRLPMAVPVRDHGGSVVGALAVGVPIEWFSPEKLRLDVPPGARFQAVDQRGTVLADLGDPAAVPLPQGDHSGFADGVIAARASIAIGDLTVTVATTRSTATRDAVGRMNALGVLSLLAISAGGFAAWRFGRRSIVDRIQRVVEVAEAVRHGRLDVRVGPMRGGDEISRLARHLDRMTGDLQARIATLSSIAAEGHREARHDGLTGLLNRRGFDETLEGTLAEARAGGARPAIILVDLDRFKPVNDRYGHPVGDALLVAVARRLRGLTASVARLGGDEFAVILPSPAPGSAQQLAQRIRDTLGEPFAINDLILRIGASVGCVAEEPCALDAQAMLRMADDLLYAEKATRRDRASIPA